MNAMYDAPVDATGHPMYAADRKAEITLSTAQQPTVLLGTDGTRLALQVKDPFGRLQRNHVVGGLLRGLSGGEMDQSHGGAGLGMMVCHNSAAAMFFDVIKGRATEVTAVFAAPNFSLAASSRVFADQNKRFSVPNLPVRSLR